MPQAGRRIEVSVGQLSFEVLYTQWSAGLQWLCRQDANCSTFFTPQGHFMCWSLKTDGELFKDCCVCDQAVSLSILWTKNLSSVSQQFFKHKPFGGFLFCLQYAAQMPSSRILENIYIQTDTS